MVTRYPLPRTASILIVLLSWGCGQIADLGERQEQSDASIHREMNVKAALLDVDEIWGAAIRVVSADGEVRLQGFVASEDERTRALEAARKAEPDVRVVDELEIWTAADGGRSSEQP